MLIKNHKLYLNDYTEVRYKQSPNSGGKIIEPKYLVHHYTAGGTLEGAVTTLTNPIKKASAHLVIGRDGSIVQLVPFNIKAWHAGQSVWQGLSGLNSYSIGIEIVNWGLLNKKDNNYYSWSGKLISKEEVFKDQNNKYWHKYTPEQIETVEAVSKLLIETYALKDILGHNDICVPVGRKLDPGPAWPLQTIKSNLLK